MGWAKHAGSFGTPYILDQMRREANENAEQVKWKKYRQGWYEGQKSLVVALREGTLRLEDISLADIEAEIQRLTD